MAHGEGGWSVRGLVPTAAGVRARLARGEVFGSHAGGILQERGKVGQQVPGRARLARGLFSVVLGGVSQSQPLTGRVRQCRTQLTEPHREGTGEEATVQALSAAEGGSGP